MIRMKCPRCGTRLTFEDADAGTTVQCTICTIPINLSAAEASGPAQAESTGVAPDRTQTEETFEVPDYAPADTFDIDDGRRTAVARREEPAPPEIEEIRLLTVRPSFWASKLLGRVASLGCLFCVFAAVGNFLQGHAGVGALLAWISFVCLMTTIVWWRYCATRRLILTTHRTMLETGRGANKRTLQVLNADIVYVNADHQHGQWMGKLDRGTLTVVATPLKLKIGPITRLTYVAAAIRAAVRRAKPREEPAEAWDFQVE